MSDEAQYNPYQLGDLAAAVGRVRPFPGSMLRQLISSLINKATSDTIVLVVADSEPQAALLRAMGARFSVNPMKRGGHVIEASGRQHVCKVVVVDTPDHPALVSATRCAPPKGSSMVIVTNQSFPNTSALAQLEQQRSAVRYQLDPAI